MRKNNPQEEETTSSRFLAEMEQEVPGPPALRAPTFLSPKGRRPPYLLEVVLRIHFLQTRNSRSGQGTRDDLIGHIPLCRFPQGR